MSYEGYYLQIEHTMSRNHYVCYELKARLMQLNPMLPTRHVY